nr:hypothetical protein [Tanacetum cinerariifolium]
MPKDPFPKSFKFNAEQFATLVALPAPFHKYLEPFLCLVGISRYYTLDEDAYPEFLGDNDEEMDLLSFIRTANPMKRTWPHCNQCAREKEKTIVADAGGPSHPPKMLREDYGALGGASAIGKSMFAVQSLFTEAVLNVKARAEVDSIVRSSAPTIATGTTMTATIDTDATAARAPATPSLFGVGSSLTSRTDSVPGGFSDVFGSDFLISGICTVVDPDFDLQKVYISLNAEVRMRTEYNIREKRKLRAVVDEQAELLKVKYGEIESLKAQLMLKEAEAAKAIRLQAQEVVNLDAQVTTVKFQIDNLVDQASRKGAAISKAVEKGLKEGLSAGITHGAKGRKLADVTAYNPSTEADYLSTLQHLQNVNISLIAELKSNKDASVDTIMNLLRLDDRVVGASALSLSLEVSHSWVKKIRENIAKHVSALHGMFVPLSEPLSVGALEGMEGTSDSTHDATTTLSMTFVFASTILPIFTDDYEVAHADCHGVLMSKLIPKASLFLAMSTSAVLKVGMPISAGITASAP